MLKNKGAAIATGVMLFGIVGLQTASAASAVSLIPARPLQTSTISTSAGAGYNWTVMKQGTGGYDGNIGYWGDHIASSADGKSLVMTGRSDIFWPTTDTSVVNISISHDAGATWQSYVMPKLPTGYDAVTSVAISRNGQTIAAPSLLGIYISTDGGTTWTFNPGVGIGEVEMSADGSILYNYGGSAVYSTQDIYAQHWAATPGSQTTWFWSSVDGGKTWQSKATSPSQIWKSGNTGSYSTLDTSIPKSLDLSIFTTNIDDLLKVNGAGNQLAIISTTDDSVYTSTDGGAHWTKRLTLNGTPVDESTKGNGCVDVSLVWRFQCSKLYHVSLSGAIGGNRLIAASDGDPNIYISNDAGVTWTPHTVNSSQSNGKGFSAVGSSGDFSHLFAGEEYGNLFTSTDFGITWIPVPSMPKNYWWDSITVSTDGTHAYALADYTQAYPGSSTKLITGVITTGTSTPDTGPQQPTFPAPQMTISGVSTTTVGQSSTITATFTPGTGDTILSAILNVVAPDGTISYIPKASYNSQVTYTLIPTMPGTYTFTGTVQTSAYPTPSPIGQSVIVTVLPKSIGTGAPSPTGTIAAGRTSMNVGDSSMITALFYPGTGDTLTNTSIAEIDASSTLTLIANSGANWGTPVKSQLNYSFVPTSPGTYTFRGRVQTAQHTDVAITQQVRVTVKPASLTNASKLSQLAALVVSLQSILDALKVQLAQ